MVRASVDEENFNKMKTFYSSCMNEDELKKAGTGPLKEVLGEVNQLFPLDDAAYTDSKNVTVADAPFIGKTLVWLHQRAVRTLEVIAPGIDDKNPVSKSFPRPVCVRCFVTDHSLSGSKRHLLGAPQ